MNATVDTTVIDDLRRRDRRQGWLERLPVARVQRPDWDIRGHCYGLPIDTMFPGSGGSGSRHALDICVACPSQLSCLAAARIDEHRPGLRHDHTNIYGVRGGLTATDRAAAYNQIGPPPK